jgi:hypothetical protein
MEIIRLYYGACVAGSGMRITCDVQFLGPVICKTSKIVVRKLFVLGPVFVVRTLYFVLALNFGGTLFRK